MKSWKKVLSACLAVLMLTGCSAAPGSSASDTGKENSSASGTESSAADDGWTLAATDPWAAYPETITYTVGKTAPDAGYSGLDGTEYEGDNEENNIRTRFYEKHLNAKMKVAFSAASGEAYDQQVSMALVSGEIPDIMYVSDYTTVKQLAENDLIADLTDVYETVASDITKDMYDSYDGRCLNGASMDGRLMALPGTTIDTGAELLWLRQDWMDKLNLEAPKSLEDVEAILKAFVENDPDGNGTNDTIGMILSNEIYGKYGGSPMYANNVFAAFGATPGQWIEKDGQVVYGSVQPEMKDALQVLANWYQEGLIDPQMAVRNQEDSQSLVINGQCGAVYGPWWTSNWIGQTHTINRDARWTPYVVPVGDDGKVKTFANNPCEGYLVVRKGYEHPELVVKLLNYTYDYTRFSEHKNDEDCLEFEDPYGGLNANIYLRSLGPVGINFDYFDAIYRATDDIKAYLDGKEVDTFPWVITCGEYCKSMIEKMDSDDWENISYVEAAQYYGRCVAGEVMEETESDTVYPVFYGVTSSMQTMWESLSKMESETMLKIVTGEKPVEYFDEFASTWKTAGGDVITQEVAEAIK